MLPFGEFPLRKGATTLRLMRSLIRVSSDLRLLALTRGGIAACRALLRLSSRAILQTAWHVRANGSVCLAFGENLYCVFSTYFSVYFVVLRVVIWPMHGVIVSIFVTRNFKELISPLAPHVLGGELHHFYGCCP